MQHLPVSDRMHYQISPRKQLRRSPIQSRKVLIGPYSPRRTLDDMRKLDTKAYLE